MENKKKSILFNAEMVRAILAGQKTCTRRLPNKRVREEYFAYDDWANTVGGSGIKKLSEKEFYEQYPPYQVGDILYVRETWERFECWNCEGDERGNCPKEPKKSVLDKTCGCYMYRATDEISGDAKWHPSIRMPKEAARIWLKVTDVRVERLQDIDEDGVWDEGFKFKPPCLTRVSADGHTCDLDGPCTSSIKYCDMTMGELFGRELWNSTIKKSDLDSYGWDANPWVWVIEFERCDKEGRAVDGR
ncbi:hypothetical protein DW779_07160 [Clostridium sp. AM30-24]|nr:hypothetical protein [Clostridium sp. AM30-24]RHT42890.1 hypothetical protein DW779_07160 [Clostridium sp. AM30-24]